MATDFITLVQAFDLVSLITCYRWRVGTGDSAKQEHECVFGVSPLRREA